MSLTDILVVVDDAAAVAARVAPVAAAAQRLRARLTGLFATGVPTAGAFGDIAASQQLVDAYLAAQRAEATRAETAFRQELARFQLAGDWLYRESDTTRGIIDTARLYDLLVIGQSDSAPDSERLPALQPEEIVMACGRPVLMIPFAGDFADIGRRALVAWNGSREATRALHDALPLMAGAEAVAVIEIDPAPGEDAAGLRAADIAEFLTRRGISARPETATSGDVSIEDLLLSRAADLAADLIVMGAYGRWRLSEAVLGGVSRSIFQQMTVPVLMAH